MKSVITAIVISMVLALAPAPKITVNNAKVLYVAAMYKTAVGDTDAAVRLLRRAEQAKDTATVQSGVLQAAVITSAILTTL
jgi:protein involved in temperature-dependent protein secretion